MQSLLFLSIITLTPTSGIVVVIHNGKDMSNADFHIVYTKLRELTSMQERNEEKND